MCVLSPERDSKNDSQATRAWPPSALSASLDILTGAAPNPTLSKVTEAGHREAVAAFPAAAREAASAGLESVRRIVIPPPSVPLDMPPLRR
jgi:hypothetical protein